MKKSSPESAFGLTAPRRRSLPQSDAHWGINDSSFYDYDHRIYGTVGSNILLQTLLERFGTGEERVMLDVAGGSNGKAVQDLVERGIVNKGLVTNLEDRRTLKTRHLGSLGHVAGNLVHQKTWDDIEVWREQHAPEGFSFTSHLPVAGLQRLQPEFYFQATRMLVDMAAPGGLLMLQVPSVLRDNTPATLIPEDCFLRTDPAIERTRILVDNLDNMVPRFVQIEMAA